MQECLGYKNSPPCGGFTITTKILSNKEIIKVNAKKMGREWGRNFRVRPSGVC
jgi:hypothetical protein